jgi:hypothetical protein
VRSEHRGPECRWPLPACGDCAGRPVSMSAEEFVAPRRAVAADDINLKIGIPERSSEVVEEVEYPRSYS